MRLQVMTHPLLDLSAFVTTFEAGLGQVVVPQAWASMLSLNYLGEKMQATDLHRKEVRDLLRFGGFKPTGRSKPASEYLIKAANDNHLGLINVAVDACNIVSLHSGLPISVVDLDLMELEAADGVELARVEIAKSGESYVFNQSGQTIDIGGLLCVFDQAGPCANAVKDSHRTKTSASTVRTLSIVWGSVKFPNYTQLVTQWYQSLLSQVNSVTEFLGPQ